MNHGIKYYVDPFNVTDFNRTEEELQTFWLFCITVAGKNSEIQAKKLQQFLEPCLSNDKTPFEYINSFYDNQMYHPYWPLIEQLREVKMGQYDRIAKAFVGSYNLLKDMSTVSLQELESVYGVGPKTARFFLVHTRPNQRYAVLDTHILRWMREELKIPTPKNTPPAGGKYNHLEQEFLNYASDVGLEPAHLDLQIWKHYNKKLDKV